MTQKVRDLRWWEKPLVAFARSRLGGWYFVNVAPIIDRRLMPLTKGNLSTGMGQPVGLLTMTGAKTGLPRKTPLLCTPDGENYIVIASRGGDTKHPAWYYNLKAHPEIQLLIFGEEKTYIAHETTGAEREALWQKAAFFYPGYEDYQQRAGGRVIPVFLLTPK